jgi:hypothetical protein
MAAYDPGACDTFTTMPSPPRSFYLGDWEVTDELAPELADDAILAGILRKAVNGGAAYGVTLSRTHGGPWHLSTGTLRITETERDALRRAARQP